MLMTVHVNRKDISSIPMEGHVTYKLLDDLNGCVAGCCTGISVYSTTEYPTANSHEDQEGFVVLTGRGWAKVGNEEFRIEPEVSFIASAGVKHCIKRDEDSEPVKVFWFHAAI